ncbi:MAG: twin-arginine translocase subunit TatC [Alistipes sp.]|nr:twin-arginine translocase subunit TatC [Alistipes sp.]
MNKEKEIEKDIDDMSFFEHLDAMRPGLIRCVILFFIAMVVALLFKDYIMAVIMGPKSPDFPTNALMFHLAEIMDSEVLKINQSPVTLINTTMAGQFNMHLLTAFYTALVAICLIYYSSYGYL